MKLAFDTPNPHEVRPRDIMQYDTFRRKFGTDELESELQLAEKFHAARILFEKGNERVYMNAVFKTEETPTESKVSSDVCGTTDTEFTLVFFEASAPNEELRRKLRIVEKASNARALVLYPFSATLPSPPEIETEYQKLDVAHVPWLDEQIDNTFREVIQMVELLANQTRVRMLTPLLERGFKKRDYRRVINPKLLYENLANLLESGIIDEAEDESYRLTQFGSDILGEYLAFLERVRRVIQREADE